MASITARAAVQVDVSWEIWRERPELVDDFAPTDPTYVKGPRGGRYLAIGPWMKLVDESVWDDFGQLNSKVTVTWRSAGLKYVRINRGG